MKFRIERTSSKLRRPCNKAYQELGSYQWYVDIETLADLIALRQEVKERLIIDSPFTAIGETLWEIEVYDSLRES